MSRLNIELAGEIKKLSESKTPNVQVTITNIKGSAPQNLGAKMLVGPSGLLWGTVGGGKVEAHCIEHAKNLLMSQTQVESHTWNLQKDIGMTCGGEVSFLFENSNTQSDLKIAIFGAGHVSQALTRTLLPLDCSIKVIENREEWLEKFPQGSNLEVIKTDDLKSIVESLDPTTFVISMTQGHAHDVPILAKALKKDFPFVGVIGSKSKRGAIEKDLKSLNLSETEISKLICPVGLDLGRNDPYEIAISIVAQILQIRGN